VLVQPTAATRQRARNEEEATAMAPPRRPKRGYTASAICAEGCGVETCVIGTTPSQGVMVG